MSEQPLGVTFRRLVKDDFVQMKQWLDDPDVSPWYESDRTEMDALSEKYGEKIRGDGPDHGFIIRFKKQDVGYIQCYVIDHHAEYARQLQVDAGAVGIDLFIGDPSARNRGYGALVIREFLKRVVFEELKARVAIIAPEPGNIRAIRAYEKAGFAWQKTMHIVDEDSPANTGDEYVMRLTREWFYQLVCRENDPAAS